MQRDQVQEVLGRNVQRCRREKGLTQEQLAAASGYAQQKLSELENGKRNAPIFTLHRIAQALGISVAELTREIQTAIEHACPAS